MKCSGGGGFHLQATSLCPLQYIRYFVTRPNSFMALTFLVFWGNNYFVRGNSKALLPTNSHHLFCSLLPREVTFYFNWPWSHIHLVALLTSFQKCILLCCKFLGCISEKISSGGMVYVKAPFYGKTLQFYTNISFIHEVNTVFRIPSFWRVV